MRPKTTTIATAHDSDNTSSPADSDDDASSPPSGVPLLDLVTQRARSRRQQGRRRRRALLAQARGAESASQTDPHVAAFRQRQRLERDLAEEGESFISRSKFISEAGPIVFELNFHGANRNGFGMSI